MDAELSFSYEALYTMSIAHLMAYLEFQLLVESICLRAKFEWNLGAWTWIIL